MSTISGVQALASDQYLTTDNIQNIVISSANTEQSYQLPAGTKTFLLHNRGPGIIKFCFTATESATRYVTLYRNSFVTQESLNATGKIIYFQSSVSSSVLELLSWS